MDDCSITIFLRNFLRYDFFRVNISNALHDINKNSPLIPLTIILMVLFKPVPLSMYPKSFLVDNPLTALISASQSFSNG